MVWKTHIENTPKTLKIGLPILIEKYVQAICKGEDIANIAYASIGSFGNKYGETFFQLLMDDFNKKLETDDFAYKRGVVLCLSELIKSVKRDVTDKFLDRILALLNGQFMTPNIGLRKAAFQALRSFIERSSDKSLAGSVVNNFYVPFTEIND